MGVASHIRVLKAVKTQSQDIHCYFFALINTFCPFSLINNVGVKGQIYSFEGEGSKFVQGGPEKQLNNLPWPNRVKILGQPNLCSSQEETQNYCENCIISSQDKGNVYMLAIQSQHCMSSNKMRTSCVFVLQLSVKFESVLERSTQHLSLRQAGRVRRRPVQELGHWLLQVVADLTKLGTILVVGVPAWNKEHCHD